MPEKQKRPGREHDLASWAKIAQNEYWRPNLFGGFARRWRDHFPVLRASPKSQSGDHNGHDHDRFQ
jgi:hypothetical protein